MKIIEPSVELWRQGNDWADHVAKCARVCYASNKNTNNEQFVNGLIKSNHISMLRHASHYAIIPTHDRDLKDSYFDYIKNPLINIKVFEYYVYVSTNKQFILDHQDSPFIKLVIQYEVDELQFANTPIGFKLMRYTFKVVTQISTSRELNRVSPNNIAEQSTRYVYENGTLCCPHWCNIEDANKINNGDYTNHKIKMYIDTCKNSFNNYKELIDVYGLNKQDARGVLPLDTATVCIYTYSIQEWRRIIDLRYYGTTGKPHPNAKIIAGLIREKLIDEGYEFRKKD